MRPQIVVVGGILAIAVAIVVMKATGWVLPDYARNGIWSIAIAGQFQLYFQDREQRAWNRMINEKQDEEAFWEEQNTSRDYYLNFMGRMGAVWILFMIGVVANFARVFTVSIDGWPRLGICVLITAVAAAVLLRLIKPFLQLKKQWEEDAAVQRQRRKKQRELEDVIRQRKLFEEQWKAREAFIKSIKAEAVLNSQAREETMEWYEDLK